jgi:hypothetical protein
VTNRKKVAQKKIPAESFDLLKMTSDKIDECIMKHGQLRKTFLIKEAKIMEEQGQLQRDFATRAEAAAVAMGLPAANYEIDWENATFKKG